MIIISAGFMKSASTLIHDYQIEMIDLSSHRSGQKILEKFSSGRGTAYRGKLDFKTFLILIVVNFLFGDVVLKTHSGPTFYVRLLVKLGLAKVTYTYRDPRDVALSMVDHGIRTRKKELEYPEDNRGFRNILKVEDTIPQIKQEIDNWYGWKNFGDVLLIKYEDLMNDKANSLRKIVDYLGYNLSDSDFEILVSKYTSLKSRNFNKGTIERYKSEMSPTDLQIYNQALQKELTDMQYAI